MNGILGLGAAGMRAAMVELQGSAARVARAGVAPQSPLAAPAGAIDLATEAVTQMQARRHFEVSASVVKTADAMLGTLIDTLA